MSEYIYGRNAINEAIKTGRVLELYVIEEVLRKNRFSVKTTIKKRAELDKMTNGANHQGIVAKVKSYPHYELKDIIKKEKGLIVILDGIEDHQNLGAIIRTCDCAGVDGIIYRRHHGLGLNATVAKIASGALEYVKVCEVTNLSRAIDELKAAGYWVYGTDASAESYYNEVPYDRNVVLIIGSEGKGISSLVAKKCDYMIKLPMHGHINSLNASVAAGIFIYEIIQNQK